MPVRPFYDRWPQYNRRLRDVIAAMTPEQLAITPSPDGMPIWATVGHTAAMRVYWLCDVDGEPGRAFAGGEIGHREDAAVAADHGGSRLVEDAALGVMRGNRFASDGAEEFLSIAHRVAATRALDRVGIGAVHPSQPAVGGATVFIPFTREAVRRLALAPA